MSEKDFDIVEQSLRETLERLRKATDPDARKYILRAMRELLGEADRLTESQK